MKRCFIFAHCNVSVRLGNMGKHGRRKGNIPLSHTHYEVRNRSHRLGGPEARTGDFSSRVPSLDPSCRGCKLQNRWAALAVPKIQMNRYLDLLVCVCVCEWRLVEESCFITRGTTHREINRYIKLVWNISRGGLRPAGRRLSKGKGASWWLGVIVVYHKICFVRAKYQALLFLVNLTWTRQNKIYVGNFL